MKMVKKPYYMLIIYIRLPKLKTSVQYKREPFSLVTKFIGANEFTCGIVSQQFNQLTCNISKLVSKWCPMVNIGVHSHHKMIGIICK